MSCNTLSDAIRDTMKYTKERSAQAHSGSDFGQVHSTMTDMKMFRSQRNLYISGFAMFLWLWVEGG